MYRVFRETTDIRDAYDAAIRDATVKGFPDDSWLIKSRAEFSTSRLSARSFLRWLARGAFRAARPMARPIAWRLRSFFAQPTFTTAAQINAILERSSAIESARSDKNEAMLLAMSREITDISAEIAALRTAFDTRTDQ